MGQLTIDLPESISAEEARLDFAISLYRTARVNQDQAAQLSGLAPPDFVRLLAARSVPFPEVDPEDYERNVAALRARDRRKRIAISLAIVLPIALPAIWMFLICAGVFDFSKQRYYATKNAAMRLVYEWEELRAEFSNDPNDVFVDFDSRYSTVEIYGFSGDSVDGVILVPTNVFRGSLAPPRILITTDDFETIEERPVRPVWR